MGACVYSAGLNRDSLAWTAAAVALFGVGMVEWLKFGLTGRHLTLAEAIQNALVSGVLAASASPLALLQPPARWADLLLLNGTVAAIAAIVYHGMNLYCLAASGKHLSSSGAAMIVAPPLLINVLLLLESPSLPATALTVATGGWLANWPTLAEDVGRVIALFVFNEIVVCGLRTKSHRAAKQTASGPTLADAVQEHFLLLAVAVAAVAGPSIARLGSGDVFSAWPPVGKAAAAVVTTIFSQAGLWAEVYLITGVLMEAFRGTAPTSGSLRQSSLQGMTKGMIYSGVFMAILHAVNLLWSMPAVESLVRDQAWAIASILGAAAFPLAKTIIETFDGSQAFFRRAAASYRCTTLYVRGAIIGAGLNYAIGQGMAEKEMLVRVEFGLAVGVAAFAGISLLRDSVLAIRRRGRLEWRSYLVETIWGGLIGAAIGFYLDAAQVALIADKFHRYVSFAQTPERFDVYPLLSKWGFIRLGDVTGGVSLLFNEALAGVICWSVPAWLFAINRTFLTAFFRKDTAPIRSLFTRGGLTDVSRNMLEVLRWGLWMSPIINSFLRPTGEPTWYNQDGAIRTVMAIFHQATDSPEAFRAWSLHLFILLLAYDSVRILIWLDHMGLRVATLVNLSFLGMDRLDQRVARFLGAAAGGQCIPESVKRFATWAPLLIPFYIPRGHEWDVAWSQSEAIQQSAGGGLWAAMSALPWAEKIVIAACSLLASTALFTCVRLIRGHKSGSRKKEIQLRNSAYSVTMHASGEVISQSIDRGYDLSRRNYDSLHPAGRTLFLVDVEQEPGDASRAWPILGNFPPRYGELPQIESGPDAIVIRQFNEGVKATVEISLPGEGDGIELWTITLENATDAERRLKAIPYVEWVLNRSEADRGHTQYSRLFAEIGYVEETHVIIAHDKHSRAMGFLAADATPEGYLDSRVDFIGRARSLWTARALESLAFSPAEDTAPHPTFDPLGAFLMDATIAAGQSITIRLLMGFADDAAHAATLIGKHLGVSSDKPSRPALHPERGAIGHGEIPPGTPQPYWSFLDNGRTLLVRTPFTPRPFDHTLSNRLGHVVSVTNRGLHSSSNGNSQQNVLTPNWPDIVTSEVPGEAIYLYDSHERKWFSPTYHPLNDAKANYQVEFGVDGTATYHMAQASLSTELTVFVPPDEPLGVYLLTVRNLENVIRRVRVAPYFQMVLSTQPEHAGPLGTHIDDALSAIFFENPRNEYRSGPTFVAMSPAAEEVETRRGRFFGADRDISHPFLVEFGRPDAGAVADDRPIAGMLATLDIPARGECTIAIMLGQADIRAQAESLIRKYRQVAAARASLAETRKWWRECMATVRLHSSDPSFDHCLHWLKYQTLAERLWARRGYYQASGAFGFRDQLQDAVNLLWMEPQLARRQILLHASQQFVEGDVLQWFHLLQDGRTGFAARNYASDPLLWLPWAAAEYAAATGDESLFDEQTTYVEGPAPLAPLPAGKHGMAFVPHRSSRSDTVFRHCMRAIDLVLDHRMGIHGLPLICAGDWNDGLDEIGSEGKGESVWLGFFLYYILRRMAATIEKREGRGRRSHYDAKATKLKESLELAWRGDRYLRAFHDDGSEIGVKDSGVWEIDALTAAWAVIASVDHKRARTAFDTAVSVLEKDNVILLGWPPLREGTKPFLGRSSLYPEGVRENGMYCHGVQWLVGAARILCERLQDEGDFEDARKYRATAYRLWRKISPLGHTTPEEIETYGGQPNKQAADVLTVFDPGRMIWNGYTGAAGWMFRQALEGVAGARLVGGEVILPDDFGEPRGDLTLRGIRRDLRDSPLSRDAELMRSERDGQSHLAPQPHILQGATQKKGLM